MGCKIGYARNKFYKQILKLQISVKLSLVHLIHKRCLMFSGKVRKKKVKVIFPHIQETVHESIIYDVFYRPKTPFGKKMARNHFWPLERGFPTHSSEGKKIVSQNLLIGKFWLTY